MEHIESITVSINESTGEVRFLVPTSGDSPFIEANTTVTRASHVEPWNPFLRYVFYVLRAVFGESGQVAEYTRQLPCLWRVNLQPVKGPVIPIEFNSRQIAIEFEIQWLEENFL